MDPQPPPPSRLRARLAELWGGRWPSRATMARVFLGVGCAGLVVGLVGSVAALVALSDTAATLDRSLAVTSETLANVDDTVALSRDMLATVRDSLAAASATVGRLDSSTATAAEVLTNLSGLTGSNLPDALDAVNRTLPQVQRAATAIDDLRALLARAPLGPSYDPTSSLGDATARLSAALRDLPTDVAGLSGDLASLATAAGSLGGDMDRLAADLGAMNADVAAAADLAERYATNTGSARRLAEQARGDLHGQLWLARALIVALGGTFVAGQVVPLWLGLQLRRPPASSPEAELPIL